MEHLLRDVKDSTVSNLSSEVSHMASGLRALKSRLSEVQEYLNLVLEGRLPVNHDIMYHLQACYTPFILTAVLDAWTLCCFPAPSAYLKPFNLVPKHMSYKVKTSPHMAVSIVSVNVFTFCFWFFTSFTLTLHGLSFSALAQSAEMWLLLFDNVCCHSCCCRPSCSWHA